MITGSLLNKEGTTIIQRRVHWDDGRCCHRHKNQSARQVWCLTGNGSFNSSSQSLWTAARYDVPIGVDIFNNEQYQANRQNQNLYRKQMFRTGNYIGTNLELSDIDYVKLVGIYGVAGESVHDADAL